MVKPTQQPQQLSQTLREFPELAPIRDQFFLDLEGPIRDSANERGLEIKNLALKDDPGVRQFFDFLGTIQSIFQLNIQNVFDGSSNRYRQFVALFADTYVRELQQIEMISQASVTHRHPPGLHPSTTYELHRAHMFPSLLGCFIHFGQYRATEDRPYIVHTRQVHDIVANMYEPFSTSLLQTTTLHDAGEDFGHKKGNMRLAGLYEKNDLEFFDFLCKYLDRTLGSANFPPFFRNMQIPGFPVGDNFDRAVREKVPFSKAFRDLSKIPGIVPGNPKDRYRDNNFRMAEILSESDPRIRFLRFVQYMLPKCADSETNFYSYFQQSEGEVRKALKHQDPAHVAREAFKRAQMSAMVRHVVLPFMARTGATLSHYRTLDAYRVPDFDLRVKFTAQLAAYFDGKSDAGDLSMMQVFERDLKQTVRIRYESIYRRPFPEGSLEIIKWRRGIYHIKPEIRAVVKGEKDHDERKFMHIIDLRILHQDPDTAQRIKSVVENVIAGLAPVEDRTSLQAERRHPLIGKLCKVRTDRPVVREDQTSLGCVVYSLRTIAEVRRDLEGLISSIYLNQDEKDFHRMSAFLDTLGNSVLHLENHFLQIEKELRYLKGATVSSVIDSTRGIVAQVLDYFESGDDFAHRTLFGDERVQDPEGLRIYAREVADLYYLLKEQILTHMAPRISLKRFTVMVNGKKKTADTAHVTLPEQSNPLYALFYYFPFDLHHQVKNIRVNREGRQHYSGGVDALKFLTLLPDDDVYIELDSTAVDLSNIDRVKRFARETLYPSKTVPADE